MISAGSQEVIPRLTDQEREDWNRLRAEVIRLESYAVDFLQKLTEIRDRRLYRGEYMSFEAYCENELTTSSRHVNRLIVQHEVNERLGPIGPKLSESHAREVAKADPSLQVEVVKVAQAKAASEDRKPTAKDFALARKEVCEPEYEDVEPPDAAFLESDYEQAKRAVENGKQLKAFVRAIRDVKRQLSELPEAFGFELVNARESSIGKCIDDAINAIAVCIPAGVCPTCKGQCDGCHNCGNHGWVNSVMLDQIKRGS